VLTGSPNSALQRAGTHKVLGRGRPSHGVSRERWRARVLIGQRPAAELVVRRSHAMEDRQFELEDMLADSESGVAAVTELASGGDADAMYVLAMAHYDGDYVPQDSARCIELLERAVAAGHIKSTHDLGCFRYYGYRLPPNFADFKEAARLLELSVAAGYPPSMTFLASMYENGEGVPVDVERAKVLYLSAANLGDEIGRQGFDRLHGA
jgi:TPR repeat protein